MHFVDTFARHKGEPDKSLESYLKERRLELGRSIEHRKKIYLDTNYWLILRDNKIGRSNRSEVTILLDLLQEGIKLEKLICPISADIFIEILKQSDPVTLKCSVELIDMLSCGVSILGPEERVRMELLYFVHKYKSGEESCHSQMIFAWNKIAYALGFTSFCNTQFSPEDELAAQKAFLDQMWEVSLFDMINTIGIDKLRNIPRLPDISNDLNVGKRNHMQENKSFKELFLSELAGILDIYDPVLEEIFAHLYEKETGTPISKAELHSSDESRMFANLIYHSFDRNRLSDELPSLRIPATLHAAIRWDTDRKYKPTDLHDIHHAAGALPYFDFFLTEHSLRHLLTRTDLALDDLYSCRVISDSKQAVTEIKETINW